MNPSQEKSGDRIDLEQNDELWREVIRQGHRVSLRIASESMLPTLRLGDRVIVQRYPLTRQPRLGDIGLFHIHDRWIVHRIIGKAEREGQLFYRQKGDADNYSLLTAAEAVSGRVVEIERGSRQVVLEGWLQDMMMISLGSFFLVSDLLRRSVSSRWGAGTKQVSPSAWRATASWLFGRLKTMLMLVYLGIMRLTARR